METQFGLTFFVIYSGLRCLVFFTRSDVLGDVSMNTLQTEFVRLVQCSERLGPTLVAMNVYETRNDEVLVSYLLLNSNCQSIATFGHCSVENGVVTLQAFVNLSEGETRQYGCNVTSILQSGRSRMTNYVLNVTIPRTTTTSTTTPASTNLVDFTTEKQTVGLTADSWNSSDTKVAWGAFIAVAVLLGILIIANVIFCGLTLTSKDAWCKRKIISCSSTAVPQGTKLFGRAKQGLALGTKSRGWVRRDTSTGESLPPSFNSTSKSPSIPAPLPPRNVRVMQYENPLPLSGAHFLQVSDDDKCTSSDGSTSGYKKPYSSLDSEIKEKLRRLYPSRSGLCRVPGYERNTRTTSLEIGYSSSSTSNA